MKEDQSLLQRTLAAARADQQTVSAEGVDLRQGIAGQTYHESVIHTDDRGTVAEMFDTRWNWHPDPIEFVYYFTIRPGVAKGWGLHQRHEDRYFLLRGEMKLVLYDVRPESPTCGQVSELYLTENRPRLINVPAFVWHADVNIGDKEALVVNFPTIQYDHSAPDKVRLPLDTELIPYDFKGVEGW